MKITTGVLLFIFLIALIGGFAIGLSEGKNIYYPTDWACTISNEPTIISLIDNGKKVVTREGKGYCIQHLDKENIDIKLYTGKKLTAE